MIVTLTEFAAVPGMPSVPTLRAMIKADPAFPVTKLGDKGDAYEIDLEIAVAYILGQREREAQDKRERGEAINQMALDLGLGIIRDEGEGFSVSDRKALLEEEIVAIKLSKLRGELVSKASVEAALGTLLVWFRETGSSFPARLSRRLSLTRDDQIEVERMIAADQAQLVERMKRLAQIEVSEDAEDGDGDLVPAPAALDGRAL